MRIFLVFLAVALAVTSLAGGTWTGCASLCESHDDDDMMLRLTVSC